MDILFFAAVAVFILFKLREQLGKVDEEQKRDLIKKFVKEQTNQTSNTQNNQAKIIDFPNISNPDLINNSEEKPPIDIKSQNILNGLNSELKNTLEIILQKTSLSPIEFLNGATQAFEMILDAFSTSNLETLKPLLSEKIFLQFNESIKNHQNNNQILNTKIIAVDEAKISNANLDKNFANITIDFKSRQINYISNDKGEIIFGNKTEINTIHDIWTFTKDCDSTEPNWLLSKTVAN